MADTEVKEVEKTTIQIRIDTRTALLALGKKGETYDDVLGKLVDFYYKNQKE